MKQTGQMASVILARVEISDALLAEARRDPRIECCGLLAGREGVISEILPARNALQSATAYEIAPSELFSLFRKMRDQGLDHLGIYHSHPHGDNAPSPTDLQQAYYPDVAYFIVSPRPDAVRPVRAFRIADGLPTELTIQIA
jgi:proteasome lid subunit RPN8/RPN11